MIATDRRAELLDRAAALVPRLAERSAEAERLRRCPDETLADFVAAGLLRVCQPSRYGGAALGWDVLCEVARTLARGCGSQAWVQLILSDHAHKLGGFSPQAQDDVWGSDPNARCSASFDPVGTGRAVDGGATFSGRHAFASGIDHAHWLICGGQLVADGAPPERAFFLVPKHDVRVIDDWQVVGLCGTGSKSFAVDEAFVPAHRILTARDTEEATGPGRAVNREPVYRMPRAGLPPTGFAAVAIGIAEGFLADYLAYTRTRTTRGLPVAEIMATQVGVGQAAAEIEAAGLSVASAVREAMARCERGDPVDRELRLRAKRNAAYAAQTALAATMRLYNSAGGRALYTSGPLQRRVRDLIAAASHHALGWDGSAAEYGNVALGL